jgi:hypothetical protein
MANPGDAGTFDFWLTDRWYWQTVPAKSDSGTFDFWLTDRVWLVADYIAPAAVSPTPVFMRAPMWGRF